MCGILGFFNPAKNARVYSADRILPELLFVGQVRGRDGVGLFGAQARAPETVDFVKMAASADAFLEWKTSHDRFLKDADELKFVVGHNRAATRGAKDDVKATHPHVTKNIVLVHNGTLTHYPEKEHVSDSAYIAHLLEESEGDFKVAERKIFGAYALVWWDKRTNRLNFARNNARPLSFVRDVAGVWWFASEPEMLVWVLSRYNKEAKQRVELPPMRWVSFGLDGDMEEKELGFTGGSTNGPAQKTDSPLSDGTELDYSKTPEARRAWAGINWGQRSVTNSIKDVTEDKTAKGAGFPRPLALPVPYRNDSGGHFGTSTRFHRSSSTDFQRNDESHSNTRLQRRSQNGKPIVRLLHEFMGFKSGDEVMCWPIYFRQSTGGKQVIVEGPVVLWNERGEPEFVHGVIGRARIDEDYDSAFESVPEKFDHYTNMRCPVMMKVTALTFEPENAKVYINGKDAMPQDWMSAEKWDMDEEELKRAAVARMSYMMMKSIEDNLAAPEVAALEKKF